MNSKNALLMLAAVLLIVVFLFEGESPIQAVAENNPDAIEQTVGGDAVSRGQSAFVAQSSSSNQASNDSFADDEPMQFEEPEESDTTEFQSPSDGPEPGANETDLSPEAVQGKPFDPRIG